MPLGRLASRIDQDNKQHHIWLNDGTWWVHYTLNFDFRTRRVRRSLGTKSLAEAIRKRDALFARLATEGEWVSERGSEDDMPTVLPLVIAAARANGLREPVPWSARRSPCC